MTGALLALGAGIALGLFQSFNGKASGQVTIQRATVTLLVTSALIVTAAVFVTRSPRIYLDIPISAYLLFAIAGIIHFVVGWSLLSQSQRVVGAARTGSLIGTVPIFTAIVGAVFLEEYLNLASVVGIGLVVIGVYLVSNR